MSVVYRLLKSWWPNAGSSTLLNLELPVISIIVSIFSYISLIDYANALAIFMFANAFVYPITTVVIKQGSGKIICKFATKLSLSVFLLTNLTFLGYSLIFNYELILNHVFSISLIAVGMRRYLHGVVILKEATSIIFPASVIRLAVSTSGCYILITNGLNSAYAPIVALVAGAWIESLILLIFVHSKKYNSFNTFSTLDHKGMFQVYFSALFIMASALMSNSFITYLINISSDNNKSLQLESWAIFFGITCVATSSIFDIENFIIRYYKSVKNKADLINFICIALLMATFLTVVYTIILFYVISPDNLVYLQSKIYFIVFLSVLVSLLWLIRSCTRAILIMSNSTSITIASIGMSFFLALLISKNIVLNNEYQVFHSFLIYLMLIAFELIVHLIFLSGASKKSQLT